MEIAGKRRRAFYRRQVVQLENEIKASLDMEEICVDSVKAKMERFNEAARKIHEYDDQIICAMIDRDDPIEDVDQENSDISEYRDLVYMINAHIQRWLDGSSSSTEGIGAENGSTVDKRVPMKLPKLEIKKFCGKLEDWLPWWAQFRSIHESTAISKVEKFQYLVQSLVEGTRAADVVKVYHCTEENYDKAIHALRERCGNEDAITDMLMRDIVQLVTSKQKLSLTQLYDQLEGQLHSLESMGRMTKADCDILYPMLESSLSEELLRTWKRVQDRYRIDSEVNGTHDSKLELLMKFLKEEAQREDEISLALANAKATVHNRKRKVEIIEDDPVPTAAGLSTNARIVTYGHKKTANDACIFCEKPHRSKDCYSAPKMSIEEKKQKLSKAKCCFLCFRKNHLSFHCRDKGRCQSCLGKHHVLMCPKSNGTRNILKFAKAENSSGKEYPNPTSREGKIRDANKISRTITNCLSESRTATCLDEIPLQTVKVKLIGPKGNIKIVRAVLDPGAQKSAIRKSTAVELQFSISHTVLLGHYLYSGQQTKFQEHNVHRAEVRSLDNSFSLELNLIDEMTIVAGVPSIKKADIPIELQMQHITLTDSDECAEIELLLANDVYGKLLTGNIQSTDSGLIAIETKLGWVLSGERDSDSSKEIITTSMMGTLSIQQLWELDVIGIRDPIVTKSKKELDEDTKNHFLQSVQKTPDGRYQVQLPWVMSKSNVPNNWNQAVKRLASATKRLQESGLYQAYEEVFMEWMREGLIEEVPVEEIQEAKVHYLPHRAVIKNESSTTKVRPVFDASCKLAKSLSLNDCLAKGPNQLELIPDILVRFRLRKIGAIADIRKAFLMISIIPVDRNYLRFLWWEQDKVTIKVLRHRRMVFGVNCSPFQLAAVIEHHLLSEGSETAKLLHASFYVDNCVLSLDSPEEYQEFKYNAVKLMEEAKMDLRLWESNCDNFDTEKTIVSKVLGLQWNRQVDTLTPIVTQLSQPVIVTKRIILSISHSLFDPLGMYSPVSLEPKLCLRKAEVASLAWDEKVPADIEKRIRKWCEDMQQLQNVKIPRHIAKVNPECGKWELHIFTDASQEAYAAAAFLRVQVGSDVTVRLVQAKSRLAPSKATIPRLELLGCLIGARLSSSINASVNRNWKCTFWTDSMTALTWIRRNDCWGTFVNNRVTEIRKLTSVKDWRHVPGIHNPADLPSRGCSVNKFIETKWWAGPQWLLLDEIGWPREDARPKEEDIAKEKRKNAVSGLSLVERPWYLPSNKYIRNIRIVAWIRRWKNRSYRGMILDPIELAEAEIAIWRMVQSEGDIKKLHSQIELIKNRNDLWCVKLKITLRDDIGAFLMPVYLPKNHPVVDQLIMHTHLKHHHAGPQAVVVKIREVVWIPNSKKIVHKCLSHCLVCKRHSAKAFSCIEPPLPKERVNDARVFQTTGVDLGGPLFLNDGSRAYFALFTCAVYRAIHLELLLSLSTEAFILGLRRFIARRGRPEIMYSDRGTNFKGCDNLMDELDWKQITADTGTLQIQWRFNPATAAWWGGWWERLIGLVKRLMRRIFGKSKLNQVELETSLCDIEAVINSRPLTYVSEDPGECMPLTPAMFMSDVVDIGVADLDCMEREKFQRRFRYRQRLRDDLRTRFRSEYLANLVQHSNKIAHKEIQVGEIVLIGSDNTKRMDWPLAKVIEKIPGRDGVFRLVKLKTAKGEMLRPVQRLYPLELESIPQNVKLPEKEENEPSSTVEVVLDNQDKDQEETPASGEESRKSETVTRSGRIVRAPERFTYMLAGWKLINW